MPLVLTRNERRFVYGLLYFVTFLLMLGIVVFWLYFLYWVGSRIFW